MINKKDLAMVSQIFMAGSIIAVMLAAVGYMGSDIWLASTQWMLVSVFMGLVGVYLRLGK